MEMGESKIIGEGDVGTERHKMVEIARSMLSMLGRQRRMNYLLGQYH